MTCIVGLVHKGKVYMGGDSAGVSGYDITVREDPKVFNNSEFLIGFTTSFRMGQILRFQFNPPKVKGKDLYKYMCTDFIDAIRKTFKTTGFLKIHSAEESGGSFLVGYKGHLFSIDKDFQVGIPADRFDAVGSGHAYALGSMHTSAALGTISPKARIEAALQSASYFNAGVRKPFLILEN
jgi:ATP-dependent protease HslVU (ClpYQ) peptidase subunit